MRPLAILLTLAACSANPGAAETPASIQPSATAVDTVTTSETTSDHTPADAGSERETLRLSLSLYLVSDTDAGNAESGLGTQRSVADIEAIVADIAPIWAQADVVFEPVRIIEIDVPGDVLWDLAGTGQTDSFFAEFDQAGELPDAGAINGFYVREAAGVNGFTPIASRVFFVVDEPSVNDERVSSHEIGHILGLHHERIDANRLMFSGTNGELLTDTEQAVARYAAQGILDGVR